MSTFFTSDTHYFHKSILTLGHGRPFSSVEEMNETMIERWNAKVGLKDEVFHLGDFSFGGTGVTSAVFYRLNGIKHLIVGNHDSNAAKALFVSVHDYAKVNRDGMTFVLFHYPMIEWDGAYKGYAHLHGHTHGNLGGTPNGPILDIGVDCHDFAPLEVSEVAEMLKDREFVPVSHHTRKDYS